MKKYNASQNSNAFTLWYKGNSSFPIFCALAWLISKIQGPKIPNPLFDELPPLSVMKLLPHPYFPRSRLQSSKSVKKFAYAENSTSLLTVGQSAPPFSPPIGTGLLRPPFCPLRPPLRPPFPPFPPLPAAAAAVVVVDAAAAVVVAATGAVPLAAPDPPVTAPAAPTVNLVQSSWAPRLFAH